MASPAHAAFPQAPKGRSLPQSEKQIMALAKECSTMDSVRDNLIPSLFEIASFDAPRSGAKHQERRRDLLAIWDTDIFALASDHIELNTALLVFAL